MSTMWRTFDNILKYNIMEKEKINIAELLHDCPTCMELDCTMYEDVYFDSVDDLNIIHCYIKNEGFNTSITFNQHGTPHSDVKSKCVIFPKGKTTWKGFHRPFKDGDIIYVCDEYSDGTFTYVAILKQIEKGGEIKSHCFYNFEDNYFSTHDFLYDGHNTRFATEEEKEKLFDAIRENGYQWNTETKTLEKLIESKFKVGDKIKKNKDYISGIITNISDDGFYKVEYLGARGGVSYINIASQDDWELVPDKFDVTKLKPFDKVLVRSDNKHRWSTQFFERLNNKLKDSFVCMGGWRYRQCIPFEGNEHLLDTANECNKFFKVWEE